MRGLFLILAVVALASARPETYRETEDFQFSRSSSDEGSKSGFYGAQRGNMGGNYEKAHNMDVLAQNQMSSAVNQVQGELGEAAKVPTGSVFTSANTKGIYNHKYSNGADLSGRNFQEGTSFGDSQGSLSSSNLGYGLNSHSSLQNQRQGAYSSYATKNSGYNGYRTNGEYALAQNNQDALSRITGANRNVYDQQVAQTGHGGYNAYDQSLVNRQSSQNSYGSNSQTRLTSAVPVRVVIRPGSTVNVPVYAEAHENTHAASAYDANSIKSETELLSNANNQQLSGFQTASNPKSYQSSYSYRKKWEKHDTQPGVVPLAIPVNSYPVNSELIENAEGSADTAYLGSAQSQNQHYATGYNAAQHSSSSQYQAGFDAQHAKTTGANNHNSYNQLVSNADLAKLSTGTINGVPKKYESSYAYHKSWERQGDPYVIQPIPGEAHQLQTSQRLRAASATKSNYHSSQYGTHSRYSNGAVDADCDCDDEGHVRVARSVDHDNGQQVQSKWEAEDLTQQVQNKWHSEDLTQQIQQKHFGKLEDVGQQTQNKWDSEDLTQQTQGNHFEKLEDFGQQAQNKWDSEDLTQQTQQTHFGKLEDYGQQTQNKWDSEDLTQQSQRNLGKLEDVGQQTQDKWDAEDLTQQTQNFGKMYNSPNYVNGQQTQHGKFGEFPGQEMQNKWVDMHGFSQNNQNDKLNDFFQHTPNKVENYGQQTQSDLNKLDQSKQSSNTNNLLNQVTQRTSYIGMSDISSDTRNQIASGNKSEKIGQNITNGNKFIQNENLSQQSQTQWTFINRYSPNQGSDSIKPVWEQPEYLQHNDKRDEKLASNLQGLWDKIDNIEQQSSVSLNSENNKWYSSGSYNSQHSYQSWENGDRERSQSSHTDNNDNKYWNQFNTTDSKSGIEKHKEVKPNDAGRGDIGADEKSNQVTTETQVIMSYNTNTKRPKTTAEIEALSLTIATTEKINVSFNNKQSGEVLSVIGINQQWLDEQKRHNNVNNMHSTTTIRNKQMNDQTLSINEKNENGHYIFGHGIQDYDKSGIVNQHAHTTKKPVESYQHFDYDQQNLQSQTAWGHNEDFGQQVQTNLNTNDNLGHSDLTQQTQNFEQESGLPQQTEHFNSNRKNQDQRDDFYEYRYQSPSYQSNNAQIQSARNVEIVSPAIVTEITTPKPGFWKSVGSKLTTAKDKVASWFGSSS